MPIPKKPKKALTIYEPERGEVPSREHGAKDRVYGAYLEKLDPRGSDLIQEALASTEDVRFKEFLERINMPRYKRVGLQTIAKACNITLAEFNNWWSRASTQRAIAIAQTNSVIITQHIAEDAMSQQSVCPRCDGLGFVAAPEGLLPETPGYRLVKDETADEDAMWVRDCPNCDGKRKVRRPGDAHARDKILEISGLSKKGAAVQIVQNFGGTSHASAVGDLSMMDNIVDITGGDL